MIFAYTYVPKKKVPCKDQLSFWIDRIFLGFQYLQCRNTSRNLWKKFSHPFLSCQNKNCNYIKSTKDGVSKLKERLLNHSSLPTCRGHILEGCLRVLYSPNTWFFPCLKSNHDLLAGEKILKGTVDGNQKSVKKLTSWGKLVVEIRLVLYWVWNGMHVRWGSPDFWTINSISYWGSSEL